MAEKQDDAFEKLMKFTKLVKDGSIKVGKKGPVRTNNKWRSAEPKFEEKKPKSENTVQAGGMEVDESLREEYENFQKDKREREGGGGLVRRRPPEEPA